MKKNLLLKAIKEKEISTLQINEQLSNQHCQFIHENLQFEQQASHEENKDCKEMSDLFTNNEKYFQQAMGVKVDQQFLNLHQDTIATFLVKYLTDNQDKMCTVENVVEKRIAAIDGEILHKNDKLREDLDIQERRQG